MMKDDQSPATPANGLTRREFLASSGTVAAATALSGPAAVAQQTRPVDEATIKQFGPEPVAVQLDVNGQVHKLTIEPRVTLLDALRNDLAITGPKRVCDRATCGACTVHLDGRAVYACTTLAIDAQGRKIITVEGLVENGRLDPVQAAFAAEDGTMCGFCTPGLVMACRAVLNEKPHANLEEIRQGLDGNICRCGTYTKVLAAALSLARGDAKGV